MEAGLEETRDGPSLSTELGEAMDLGDDDFNGALASLVGGLDDPVESMGGHDVKECSRGEVVPNHFWLCVLLPIRVAGSGHGRAVIQSEYGHVA